MGLFDKALEAVSDVANDIVEDVSNGDVVGVIVEAATAGSLGMTNMGDIAQEQIEVIAEAGIDYVQGDEVYLEYDPEVVPALAEAGVEDAENVLEIYTELG
jgi:hypothetical protein